MFGKATQHWFDRTFTAPTEVQERGWKAIATGKHALLVAPTGSGKTLAAFLSAIDSLSRAPADATPGTRVLYVSPLKALVYDIERNLRAPLVGIRREAERQGSSLSEISVSVRTGDTSARDRQEYLRAPGQILVTTPESLFLILGSRSRQHLATVDTVIVDEVHSLFPTKRGVHLALSLERLGDLTATPFQRLGLSATVRPLDEVARYLGGREPVQIVDSSQPPRLDLKVTVPVPDMTAVDASPRERPGGPILGELYDREVGRPSPERGIWSEIYPELLTRVKENRSTIVFVNSRGLCERLTQRLNDLAGEELVLAHHGSVSHEKRREIEEALKAGRVRGIVATSSLELGIDMGAVELVVMVESPGSVARGLQRVGRAGHQVGAVSRGLVYPKFPGDLLECAVIARRMEEGELEGGRMPRLALDVLAQQVVAICCDRTRSGDEIQELVTRAAPYHDLTPSALESVLDMLTGRYPSEEFADLRPLLQWDRARDRIGPRRGALLVSRMNAGTIPDRGYFGVFLGNDGPRVGELDEEMVFETRAGENITLGATTWRVEEITRDRVLVTPAPGEPGRLPFWKGDGPGRPLELGRALGEFARELARLESEEALEWVRSRTPLDENAARNVVRYVLEQRQHCGVVPSDRTVVVERFRDELGDWRVCILTPYGGRLHAPWALALQRLLSRQSGFDVQLMYTEDGIVLRFADAEELPELETLFPSPEELQDLVTEQLADSALFAGLFRENAGRSLLIPRRRPSRRTPLWAQRLKAQGLLATVKKYPRFPIVLETYREALRDRFDLAGLEGLLRDIRARRIRVHEVETASASPFARSLVFAYVAAYLYDGDAPVAERKAQALTLDRQLLGELLGQAELRELIDESVLHRLEQVLQQQSPERRARDADEIHDLLRRLGDLSEAEIADRSTAPPSPWLEELSRQRRAYPVSLEAERRWIAVEDVALFRDALGVLPPAGLPDSLLETVEDALERLVRKFARHRGPFITSDLGRRYGLPAARLEPLLRKLEGEGVLAHGEIRPGGAELDWCHTEILRRLKRETLARLRDEVSPTEAATLGRFLPAWQGIDSDREGPDRLLEIVGQLQGLSLSWREWTQSILPRRMRGFRPDLLDLLAAHGSVVWIGRGALGPRDGRVALYLRDQAPLLLDDLAPAEPASEIHAAILDHLARHGASFSSELDGARRRRCPESTEDEFHAALWDLVWEGRITNDTFAPLRHVGKPPRSFGAGRRRRAPVPTGGRWAAVETLLAGGDASETERAVARAQMLLERYGLVSRECASAEEIRGGFGPLYRVLKAMEETGRIRRGYFVEGLSAAQFSGPGAVDRLRFLTRSHDEPLTADDVLDLSAVDPAQPFGSLVPWPPPRNAEGPLPRRVPGHRVILLRGRLALHVAPRGKRLLTFDTDLEATPEDVLRLAFQRLGERRPESGRGRTIVESVDGAPVRECPYHELLRECGFESTVRGLAATGS